MQIQNVVFHLLAFFGLLHNGSFMGWRIGIILLFSLTVFVLVSVSFLELREDGFQPPSYLVQGVKALLTALKLWMKKEVSASGFVCCYGELWLYLEVIEDLCPCHTYNYFSVNE